MEDQQPRNDRPKSIRQIRMMKKKEPKLEEGMKNTLLIRGNKTSQLTTAFLKDIVTNNNSISFCAENHKTLRHDVHPFESATQIEHYCKSTESSLFLFASNSKKRPHNIVIGRTYRYGLLDMIELGLDSYESIHDFETVLSIPVHCRPFLTFQGDIWETDEQFNKARNLLQDFFVENVKVSQVEVNTAMKVVITFTASNSPTNRIFMRTYQVNAVGKNILEDEGKLLIDEVGPKADFTFRRAKFADSQLWKEATKVPKPIVRKEDKNVSRDNMGDKRGRVYVDTQNFEALALKKRSKRANLQEKVQKKEEERKQRAEEFAS